MPSISHRANLGQGTPHRAESGSTALPAGFITGIVGWLVQWRDLLVGDHLLRDIGLADAHDVNIAPARRDHKDPKGIPTWPTIF